MSRNTIRKKFYFPLLGGAILGLVAFGCDRGEQPYGEQQSQRSQQDLLEQGQQQRQRETSQPPAQEQGPGQSAQQSAPEQGSEQQSSQESSIEGTVVKIDREKNEIVIDTSEGQKTVRIEDNTEGVEEAKEGAKVTIQVSGSGDRLKAQRIQVSMAQPDERPMPRG